MADETRGQANNLHPVLQELYEQREYGWLDILRAYDAGRSAAQPTGGNNVPSMRESRSADRVVEVGQQTGYPTIVAEQSDQTMCSAHIEKVQLGVVQPTATPPSEGDEIK